LLLATLGSSLRMGMPKRLSWLFNGCLGCKRGLSDSFSVKKLKIIKIFMFENLEELWILNVLLKKGYMLFGWPNWPTKDFSS
jgi:hypothetical protein